MTATLVYLVMTAVGAGSDATAVAELYGRLKPEMQARLGPLADLKPEAHELAAALLQPLATGGGPLSSEQIAYQTTGERLGRTRYLANQVMEHRVSLLGGYEPQSLGDPIDWLRAPKDDWQWPTHLSRHYWLTPAAYYYRASGEEKYAAEAVSILLEWVARTPILVEALEWGGVRETADGARIAEGRFKGYADGPWTSLSAHARMDYWSELFQLLWDAPAMDNQAVAALLNSLFGDHLRSMMTFPRSMNQYLSISNSLIRLGLWYPWFDGAEAAEAEGWQRLSTYTGKEMYPDGSMAECSPNYAVGCLKKVYGNVELAAKLSRPVPDMLRERVGLASRYFALISDPQGRAPRIAKGKASVRGDLALLNAAFGDPEVAFVAAAGKSGTAPAALEMLFPWAGHAVMRSGWDADATWLFMELGPRGSGHHDLAQNGIQLQAAGEWLLTDPGYYTYSNAGDEGLMNRYLTSSFAHSTATVDGLGQVRGPGGANASAGSYLWEVGDETVTTEGVYSYGYGKDGALKVVHRRRLTCYRNEDRFQIVDRFEGEGEHTAAIHWQIPPGRKVSVEQGMIHTRAERAGLRIEPAAEVPLQIEVIEGQREPLAGWFSETYGQLVPAPRVTVLATGELPLVVTTMLHIER